MVIYYIDKSPAIQAIGGFEECFSMPGYGMIIGKRIDGTMEDDPFLNVFRIIELFFSFYKITDEISCDNTRFIKRKICMRQVIHSLVFGWRIDEGDYMLYHFCHYRKFRITVR